MLQIFRVFIPASVVGLVLSEFVICFICYVLAALLLNGLINPEFSPVIFFANDNGLFRIAAVVLCIVIALYFQNLYANLRVRSLTLLVQQLCVAIGSAFLIQSLFTYLRKPDWGIPKWAMIFGSVIVLLTVPAWRVFYSSVVMRAFGAQKVIFLGTSD